MVLRKPYAFLIKHFKKINILLLALIIFVAYKDLSLYGFLKDYASTAIYNSSLDSITNYVNAWGFVSLLFILFISLTLAYLLKYKNKPYAVYIYIAISNFLTLILFFYIRYYFSPGVFSGYSMESSRNIMYLTLVTVLPYAISILLLLIRSVGLDLKKFGFSEDKEFLETNESDREEIEVEVAFDKDIFIRQVRNKIRMFKYFFLEHKFSLSAITVVVLLIISYNVYHFVYVYHKVYKMNEPFTSNNYKITIMNTYLTNKDYVGNLISKEGKYYVILDFKIVNLLNKEREFDITKFHLFVDNEFYVPDFRFNNYFSDVGRVYDGKNLARKASENYLLIYEIDKPTQKSNFLLTYQDLMSKDTKAIRIRLKLRDLSKFVQKDSKKLEETLEVPINLEEKKSFSFHEYFIGDTVKYTYEKCYVLNCPIYEGTLTGNGNTIIRLKGDFGDDSTASFVKFLKKYGKMKYTVDGVDKEIPLKFMLEKDYRGKMVYLSVPMEVKSASTVDLFFTVRTYQYFYRIKGEGITE
ncbi:MAG: hypothetical protein HFG40_03610 [Bacilli bacterium]|nr:hypothetical protein [Bacilli bacterium]